MNLNALSINVAERHIDTLNNHYIGLVVVMDRLKPLVQVRK